MADLDWFPFEPGRWLKNTLHLTARQNGAYLLMTLAAFEQRGKLPGTDAGLMTVAKLSPRDWKDDGDVLKAFLTREGDVWVHEFARHQRADAEARVAGKSRAGKAGAAKRWDGRRNGSAMAEATVRQCQTDAQEQVQRQEQVSNNLHSEREGARAPRTPKPEKADGKFKLPADWRPDLDCRAYAQDRGLDPDATADVFVDYFTNRKGKSERRDAIGWRKRWEIWCRADTDRGGTMGTRPARAAQPARGNDAFYLELAAIGDRSRAGDTVLEGRADDAIEPTIPDEAWHAPR